MRSIAYFSAAVIALLCLLALFVPIFSVYNPVKQNLLETLADPGFQHLFGTDALGRDLFVRVFYGARISLSIGFFSALLGTALGFCYGAVSAWRGGKIDQLMMRLVDILYSMPMIMLAIILILLLGEGRWSVFWTIVSLAWLSEARLARGLVLQTKTLPYVEAARASGNHPLRILLNHILPNIMGPLLVSFSFAVGNNIMLESFLSFIGLGISPPQASWGTLISEGWVAYRTYPHMIFFPAMALYLTVLSFHFLGDYIGAQGRDQN